MCFFLALILSQALGIVFQIISGAVEAADKVKSEYLLRVLWCLLLHLRQEHFNRCVNLFKIGNSNGQGPSGSIQSSSKINPNTVFTNGL